MRCLTLAAALRERGVEARFVCREHDGDLCDLIEARGFAVNRLPEIDVPVEAGETPAHARWLRASWQEDAEQTLAAIRAMNVEPDWLVVDHYALDIRWEQKLCHAVGQVMVIDDLADRTHECDLLLDQNLVALMHTRYASKIPGGCTLLLGPKYALLQPLYAQMRGHIVPRSGPIRRILVFFGGVDRANLTTRVLAALLRLNRPEIDVDIVMSKTNRHIRGVGNLIDGHNNIHLHCDLPSLAPLMEKADLAVGAGGATSWERLCLGLPALVVTLSENQRPIADELGRHGLVRWLGHSNEVDDHGLAEGIGKILCEGLDKAWSMRCLAAVDGRGASRVCAAMLSAPGSATRSRIPEPRAKRSGSNEPTIR